MAPAGSGALQAIRYSRGKLELLDQRQLPFEETFLPVQTPGVAWQHIRDMVVRGAPAIGVTGALALAVDLHANKGSGAAFADPVEAVAYINKTLDYLVTSRPTAVNLADAADKLRAAAAGAASVAGATAASVVEAVTVAAETYFSDDLLANKALGAHGAAALLAATAERGGGVGGRLRVLTHCNTGSLATAGFGTALGVVRALHEQGKLEHAFCTETRPYNQGARLTAFELVHDGLPATLVVDSAVSALMAAGRVDAIVVGADRVVANGDTANKIGTLMLAISAAHFKVPFFIAAPTTTLDPALPDGSHIEIEQRGPEEITHSRAGVRVVKEGIEVWNPGFDVAPGSLITGIITERGMVPREGGIFQVAAFCRQLAQGSAAEAGSSSTSDAATATASAAAAPPRAAAASPMPSFLQLDLERVRGYIAENASLSPLVGPPESSAAWAVREVGDGNINFVYIVEGPVGALCIKQALPYVRCVGESWPLSQDRVRIEAEALMAEARLVPQHVPKVHLYDPANYIIVMQYLPAPFIIIRRGLIAGTVYPLMAAHVAEFLAQTLFHTSLIKLDSETFRQRVALFSNNEMCRLTEQVLFMEPYTTADNNRWTTPQLDGDVAALHRDVEAKAAISALKAKFVQNAEALLHGDLHTGSIMATQSETFMIDPEFAFYGPMAFDVAKILGELLLCFFASHGHEADAGGADLAAQRRWLLASVCDIWRLFSARFVELWDAEGLQGDLFPGKLLGAGAPAGPLGVAACQELYLSTLWTDTVSFAGAVMIRRLVGISHVADMDSITDADVRAGCERRALRFGRGLLVNAEAYMTVESVVQTAMMASVAQA